MHYYNIIKAEILKSHQLKYKSKFSIVTLFIWPFLVLSQTYYTFSSFDLNTNNLIFFNDNQELLLFIVVGYWGFNCFWAVIQSAWQSSYERINGTLEIIFMTPASKILIFLGRSIGSFQECFAISTLYCILIFLNLQDPIEMKMFKIIICMLIMFISSIISGIFFNTIFLFSRDTSFLFTIFDGPMEFFSGVKFPIYFFPPVLKFISFLFPLTITLEVCRAIIYSNTINISILILFILTNIIIILISFILVSYMEKNIRKKGELHLY